MFFITQVKQAPGTDAAADKEYQKAVHCSKDGCIYQFRIVWHDPAEESFCIGFDTDEDACDTLCSIGSSTAVGITDFLECNDANPLFENADVLSDEEDKDDEDDKDSEEEEIDEDKKGDKSSSDSDQEGGKKSSSSEGEEAEEGEEAD